MSTLALAKAAAEGAARAEAVSATPALGPATLLSAAAKGPATPTIPPAQAPAPTPAGPVPSGIHGTVVDNTLTALVRYIPTEVMTLYIAAVSVGSGFKAVIPTYTPTLLYWVFVILTPIFFYLVYLNQLASMQHPIPHIKNWPKWKPTASTIAFIVWALAIPNNPYVEGPAGAAVAGFAVLFVSVILSLLSPIFER